MPLLTTLWALPWVRKVALYGAIALAVVLILLGFRRSGEKAGEAKVKLEDAHAQAQAAKRIQDAIASAPSTRDERTRQLRDGSRKL